MFVHGFEEGWLKHPFWRDRFLIKDQSRLREMQESGIQHCWIDVSKGRDVPSEKPQDPAPAEVANLQHLPEPKRERISLFDELQQAARLRARSAEAMRRMFTEVRLGNAI